MRGLAHTEASKNKFFKQFFIVILYQGPQHKAYLLDIYNIILIA